MGDLCRAMIALGGCAIFIVVALLTFIAVRVEQARRALVRPPPPCRRLHASDLTLPTFERAESPPITAEELPAFRRPRRQPRVVDEDEVNPRIR